MNGRLAIEHLAYTLHARVDLADGVPFFDDAAGRLEHVLHVLDKSHQQANAEGDRGPEYQPDAKPDNRPGADRLYDADDPTEPGLMTRRFKRRLHRLLVLLRETLLIREAATESLDDANRGQHFLGGRGKLALARPQLHRRGLDALREVVRDECDERDDHRSDDGDLPGIDHHGGQDEADEEQAPGKIRQRGDHEILQGRDVARQAGQQIACALLSVEGERQSLEVRIESDAQVEAE